MKYRANETCDEFDLELMPNQSRLLDIQTTAPKSTSTRVRKKAAKNDDVPAIGDWFIRFRNAKSKDELHESFRAWTNVEERYSDEDRAAAQELAEKCEADFKADETSKRIASAVSQDELNVIAAETENVWELSRTASTRIRMALEDRRVEIDRAASKPTPTIEDLEATIRRVVEETLARVAGASAAPVEEPKPDPDVVELEAAREELDALTTKVASVKRRVRTLEERIMRRAVAASRPTPLLTLAEGSDE